MMANTYFTGIGPGVTKKGVRASRKNCCTHLAFSSKIFNFYENSQKIIKLSALSKVLEKIILVRMMTFLGASVWFSPEV